MADPRPWQHVSEPATPVETDGPRVCAGCGYQMGQAICTHCGKPTETAGHRLAREWFVEWRPNLADLARRIDEDRAEILADMEASDLAALSLHEILAAIKEALGCDGPVSGDALVAHAAALRQKRDALAQERDRLAGERDTLRAALLATRDHNEPDGPCWCWSRRRDKRDEGPPSRAGLPDHWPVCLQARAALGCEPMPPLSIRGLDPNFTTEPAP